MGATPLIHAARSGCDATAIDLLCYANLDTVNASDNVSSLLRHMAGGLILIAP